MRVTVISTTLLPGDERKWALAVARLPDCASVVLKGESRVGPAPASAETAGAWAQTVQAIARERALWCESIVDGGRLVVLVLPFGLVPDEHHRIPRGALCIACEPPDFSPVALPLVVKEAVFRAALAVVVPGKERGGDSESGVEVDAWEPVSNWAGVPVPALSRVVGVCTDTASFCTLLADRDWDLELPEMRSAACTLEGMLRGPDAGLLHNPREVGEDEAYCTRCQPNGGGCLAGRPPVMVDVPDPPLRARRPIFRVAEPED